MQIELSLYTILAIHRPHSVSSTELTRCWVVSLVVMDVSGSIGKDVHNNTLLLSSTSTEIVVLMSHEFHQVLSY